MIEMVNVLFVEIKLNDKDLIKNVVDIIDEKEGNFVYVDFSVILVNLKNFNNKDEIFINEIHAFEDD